MKPHLQRQHQHPLQAVWHGRVAASSAWHRYGVAIVCKCRRRGAALRISLRRGQLASARFVKLAGGSK